MPDVPPTRFVYLGPEGTFSEQALLTLPAAVKGVRMPARSVPEAIEAVRNGDADAALVPLENSIGGEGGGPLGEVGNGSAPGGPPGGGAPGRVGFAPPARGPPRGGP